MPARAGWSPGHLPRSRGAARARLDALPQTAGEALIRTIWGPMGYSRFVTERRLDPGKFSILCMLAAPQPSAAAFLARLDTLRQLIRTHRDAPDARLTPRPSTAARARV
ncbi:MAG: hypothetical protein ACLUFI_04950 [Oscillospiraceae bacterium]